jgi:septum formation protein
MGVAYQTVAVAVDEARLPAETPDAYVRRLAAAKAESGWLATRAAAGERAGMAATPVLGADTAVVVDDTVFGKPADRADGLEMLRRLSGRAHRVLTAVAIRTRTGILERLSETEVSFRTLCDDECAAYWDTGEPRDKAGGYAIQGFGAVFVAQLRGSHSGVVGLPIFETAGLLETAGVPLWRQA